MRLPQRVGWSLAVGLMAAWSAHAAGTPDDDAMSELKEHHRHHHHGGVTHFIAMSLDGLGVDEAKRPQLEKIQDALHACTAQGHEAERGMLRALADGVAAGAVDVTKVDADLAKLDAAAASAHDCSASTLNELHALLSPPERVALAQKVQAHWDVWRHVNHDAQIGGKEEGGRLAALAKELNLTPEQVDKISAALQQSKPHAFDPEKAHAHVQAFATAFASDTFDAKALTGNANGAMASHGAHRMARFYEAVAPVLTPEQRTTLAEHLREHASHQPAPKQ